MIPPVRPDGLARPAVAVIGGGISGLVAAWELGRHRPDAAITVYEATDRVGGKLHSAPVAGHSVDVGAESLLIRRPEAVELAAQLGFELEHPLTTAATITVGGHSHPIPSGTVMGVPASTTGLQGLLSPPALRRVADEPLLPPLAPLLDDLSVAELVSQRLGPEILDRLVEPLLGGVYAGRAEQLSVRATLPSLAAALGKGGSLVDAARSTLSPSRPTGPVFGAPAGGVGRLPLELAQRGNFDVETGVTVREIQKTESGYQLVVGAVSRSRTVSVDAVVVAAPAAASSRLLQQVAPRAARELAEVETASVAVVSMAYRDVALPAGSGTLVAGSEGLRVKAVTLSSQKWGGAPPGLTLLRASLGRAGDSRDLQFDDAELITRVQRELRRLYGLVAHPIDTRVTRWGGGLPQYHVGHLERVARIRAEVAKVDGLAVCGASYDGVGIPACIGSARQAAEAVLPALAPRALGGTDD